MIIMSSGMGLLIEAWKISKAVDVKVVRAQPGALIPYKIQIKDKHVLTEDEEKTKEYDKLAYKVCQTSDYDDETHLTSFPLTVGVDDDVAPPRRLHDLLSLPQRASFLVVFRNRNSLLVHLSDGFRSTYSSIGHQLCMFLIKLFCRFRRADPALMRIAETEISRTYPDESDE